MGINSKNISSARNTVIIGVVAIIAIFALLWFLETRINSDVQASAQSGVSVTTRKIPTGVFDNNLFASDKYRALKDNTVPVKSVTDIKTGKSDPFSSD